MVHAFAVGKTSPRSLGEQSLRIGSRLFSISDWYCLLLISIAVSDAVWSFPGAAVTLRVHLIIPLGLPVDLAGCTGLAGLLTVAFFAAFIVVAARATLSLSINAFYRRKNGCCLYCLLFCGRAGLSQ
jgi:hypothetical protein